MLRFQNGAMSTGCGRLAHTSSSTWRFSRRSSVRVAASWGAPVAYTTTKVLSREAAAKGQIKLVVAADNAASYTKPGQYVMLKQGDVKPGFFAIASAPAQSSSSGTYELLIKQAAPGANNMAEVLTALQPGAPVEISAAQGKGFPVDRIPADQVPHVLLFATGTGISPIKAVIESGVLGQRRSIRLFYGSRNPESTAYGDLDAAWQQLGVSVTHVYSDSKKGYVQDALAASTGGTGVLEDPVGTGVLLCGQGDMCKAVTAVLTGMGVAADKIMMNY